ncbi:hypothetical protein [Arhodomonas sp. SL1]|uniref:hypothetical protein n=1 Tax=Arhodomonas sp. SL1 TaxID=3425691 RepID=UPI003F885635
MAGTSIGVAESLCPMPVHSSDGEVKITLSVDHRLVVRGGGDAGALSMALVAQQLSKDPFSRHIFVFRSARSARNRRC